MSKRKQHQPEFKAKVALEALKGEETVSKLASVEARRAMPLGPDVFMIETKSDNCRGFAEQMLRKVGERPTKRCSNFSVGMAAMAKVGRYGRS